MLPNQGPDFNALERGGMKVSNHSSASKAASAEQHGSAWPLLRHQQVALQAARCCGSWCSHRCCVVAPVRSSVKSVGCQSGVERLHVGLLLPVVVHKAGGNPALSGYVSAV